MGATDSNGKQPAVTAATITNDEIRVLRAAGYIDPSTLWDAIYNDHTAVGLQARERCAKTHNAIALADDTVVVSVEACS